MADPLEPARSLLHAAFHEAGHFVAHHYLVPSEAPVGIAIFGEATGYYAGGEAVHDPRGRVVAIYAGALADARLDPDHGDEIRALASGDDEEAAIWLRRLGEPDRESEYRQWARALVARHWRDIEVIAAMLLEVGALRGDVAKMILDLANGVDARDAALRLDLAPDAAAAVTLAFAFRLARVTDVLASHGYGGAGRGTAPRRV